MLDMEKPNPEPSLDMNALRLPQNFGESLGVRKILTNVTVGKPGGDRFFRCHPQESMKFMALIYEDKASRESYLVSPSVADLFGRLAKPVMLHLAVDRRGNPFLIPVALPSSNGSRNPWHESLDQAIQAAEKEWVRITANMAAGVYDVFVATAELAEPEWPSMSLEAILQIAFRGKIIDSPNHPVIQGLQGRV